MPCIIPALPHFTCYPLCILHALYTNFSTLCIPFSANLLAFSPPATIHSLPDVLHEVVPLTYFQYFLKNVFFHDLKQTQLLVASSTYHMTTGIVAPPLRYPHGICSFRAGVFACASPARPSWWLLWSGLWAPRDGNGESLGGTARGFGCLQSNSRRLPLTLAVAPAAGVWYVRGGGARKGREVAGVWGQPGTVAGPLPAAGTPRCLISSTRPQTSVGQTGAVPGESCPQEDFGMWLRRSDRMDTPKLCCLGKGDFHLVLIDKCLFPVWVNTNISCLLKADFS